MNRTCSAHSEYNCDEQKCKDELRHRRQQEDNENTRRQNDQMMQNITMMIATGLL